MSPWNLLLESLHSSLLDELLERVPQAKPELGLPRRDPGLLWPDPGVETLFAWKIELTGGRGFAFLGFDFEAQKRIQVEPVVFWESLLARAKKLEFPRRAIAPEFTDPKQIKAQKSIDHPKPKMVIWIPFGLLPGRTYLGIGV